MLNEIEAYSSLTKEYKEGKINAFKTAVDNL
jgi:hypothetical protein